MFYFKKKSPELTPEQHTHKKPEPTTQKEIKQAPSPTQERNLSNTQAKHTNNQSSQQGDNSPSYSTATKSFKDLLKHEKTEEKKPEKQEEQQEIAADTSESISIEQIREIWSLAKEPFKNEPSSHAILSESSFSITDNTIFVKLSAATQQTTFEQDIVPRLQEKILFHLQKKYNIHLHHITIKTIVPEIQQDEVKRPLTPDERYNHLKNINEKIEKLRNALDLDIE